MVVTKCSGKTTQVWFFQVLWRDGSTSWEPLKNLRVLHPIEIAEYVIAKKLAEEPAFAWWVPHTLKKRDRIISQVRRATAKKDNKFGLEVPRSVKQALEIDRETGTDHWIKAIEKETKHVMCAFNILEEGAPEPKMSKRIPCHLIFDIKMYFTQKARFVAGGHVTDPPASITFASIASHDSVRLAFLRAALNDLEILGADIGNAYLNASTSEKVHTICVLEFGQAYLGCYAIITRALYGLKSSSAAWRNTLAGTLGNLGFKPTLADPDVWIRPASKLNGEHYYEYLFVYVDDILVLSEKPEIVMQGISKAYCLKEGSVGRPTAYLGAQIKEHRLPDNPTKVLWSMSAEKYLKEAIRVVEMDLSKLDRCLPVNVPTPLWLLPRVKCIIIVG